MKLVTLALGALGTLLGEKLKEEEEKEEEGEEEEEEGEGTQKGKSKEDEKEKTVEEGEKGGGVVGRIGEEVGGMESGAIMEKGGGLGLGGGGGGGVGGGRKSLRTLLSHLSLEGLQIVLDKIGLTCLLLRYV